MYHLSCGGEITNAGEITTAITNSGDAQVTEGWPPRLFRGGVSIPATGRTLHGAHEVTRPDLMILRMTMKPG